MKGAPRSTNYHTLKKLISSVFSTDEITNDVSECSRDSATNVESSRCVLPITHQPYDFIHLSLLMQDTFVIPPTLNE